LSAISRASPRAAAISASGSWTERTSRSRSASCASKTRPVKHHSSAVWMPTTRGRNQLDAASGVMPRRENTKPKRAALDASRMSIGSCIVAPMPTAAPLIAPITGFTLRKIRSVTMPPPSR
jgi:hypothetical protein